MLKTFRQAWAILERGMRRKVLLILGVSLIVSLLETFGIALILPLIKIIESPQIIQENRWLRLLYESLHLQNSQQMLGVLCGGLVVFFILKNLCIGASIYQQAHFVFTHRSGIARRLFVLYLRMPYVHYLTRHSAELEANIRENVIIFFNFIETALKFLADLLVVSVILLMLVWINPTVTFLVLLIFGGFGGATFKFFGRYSHRLGQQVKESQKDIFQSVIEGFGAIKEVKVSGEPTFFSQIYYRAMQKNAQANWKMQTVSNVPSLIMEVLAILGCVAIILVLQISGASQESLFSTLGVFAMASAKLMPRIASVMRGVSQLKFTTPGVGILSREIQRYRADWDAQNLALTPVGRLPFRESLEIRALSFTYPGAEKPALDGVTLRIEKGQSVAFVGSSGAGKTTLANILLGLLEPNAGSLQADGQEIWQQIQAWQKNIGYVPQSIYLLDGSIRENIAFACLPEAIDEEQVWQALRVAQLAEFVKGLPEGLATRIGENGVRLSGGQRQRLGIARAVYHQPEILILDEATSALDTHTEQEVSAAIESLAGQMTLILIAHRLSTIRHCEQIFLFQGGRLIHQGSFEELQRQSPEFQKMAGLD